MDMFTPPKFDFLSQPVAVRYTVTSPITVTHIGGMPRIPVITSSTMRRRGALIPTRIEDGRDTLRKGLDSRSFLMHRRRNLRRLQRFLTPASHRWNRFR